MNCNVCWSNVDRKPCPVHNRLTVSGDASLEMITSLWKKRKNVLIRTVRFMDSRILWIVTRNAVKSRAVSKYDTRLSSAACSQTCNWFPTLAPNVTGTSIVLQFVEKVNSSFTLSNTLTNDKISKIWRQQPQTAAIRGVRFRTQSSDRQYLLSARAVVLC